MHPKPCCIRQDNIVAVLSDRPDFADLDNQLLWPTHRYNHKLNNDLYFRLDKKNVGAENVWHTWPRVKGIYRNVVVKSHAYFDL